MNTSPNTHPRIVDFRNNISLYRLTGQDSAKKLLLTQIDQYYNDIRAGRSNIIPAVLIIGKTANTMARAYSNTFGNSFFYEIESEFLGFGMNLNNFLLQGNSNSTYFIGHIEDMTDFTIPELYRIINERMLHVASGTCPPRYRKHDFNRLIIACSEDKKEINPTLLKCFEVVCILKEYNKEEIYGILSQHVTFTGINVKDKTTLYTIAQLCNGNVELATTILKWMYRCCRAKDEEVMTTKHLNEALHMLQNTM